jgi:SHS2 domain-containing protein
MSDVAESLFREIEHTADLGIEVEADTPDELFRRAGLALFSLMVTLEKVEPREEREVRAQAEGWEDLLHDWLSRLLCGFLQEGFIAAQITIEEVDATRIRARLAGEKLDYERHGFETEMKAVTYHQLSVTCENGCWQARVIFDV